MIELKQITKDYPISQENTVHAVRGVDLRVEDGDFLVITGRSGSGKTTLLNLIAGLAKPSAGQVIWDGANLWALSDARQSALRNQQVGFVFQFPSLLPGLTILENVALPAMFSANGLRAEANDRAVDLLKNVGLQEKLYAYPRQLSAGQQQRVVVARALLTHPRLLLADEPTSNLDEQTECEIMDLFRQIHQATKITLILVTHTRQLIRYGTRAIEMANGEIKKGG